MPGKRKKIIAKSLHTKYNTPLLEEGGGEKIL
jgi:hypothetical protein